jgi:SAM-dependent methyltransferase
MNQEISKQRSYWDKEAESFDAIYSKRKSKFGVLLDSLFRWDMYKRFDYTMENAEPVHNRTFLDVGCGTGKYSLELARRNASEVIGLDISEEMIRLCQQRALAEQLGDRVRFIQTDLLEYQPDDEFDVCIGIGLFDYLREPLPVLTRMRECVRDRVIVSFPRFWTWRAPVRRIRLGLRQCDVFFFTRADIDDLVRRAGFEEYSIQRIGQLTAKVALEWSLYLRPFLDYLAWDRTKDVTKTDVLRFFMAEKLDPRIRSYSSRCPLMRGDPVRPIVRTKEIGVEFC